MTTYKTGEFSNSTEKDQKDYFSGNRGPEIEPTANDEAVREGVYRVEGDRLMLVE